MARKIQDIVENRNILASEMPFSNFYAEEPYTFTNNGYTMKLQDPDTVLGSFTYGLVGDDSTKRGGRLYFIVANDYEIDVAIWTNRNGVFRGIADDPSYNLKVDSDFFDLSDIGSDKDSFIEFTMRPNSILGLDQFGDTGAWSYRGDRFEQIITPIAGELTGAKSMVAILTNPDRTYSGGNVKTITVDSIDFNVYAKEEWWIEITDVRKVDPRMQEVEGYQGLEEEIADFYIDSTKWSIVVNPQFPDGAITSGQDTNNANWTVEIRQRARSITGDVEYAVFVDGILQRETVGEYLAFTAEYYRLYAEARRTQGQNYVKPEPPKNITDIDKDTVFGFLGDVGKIGFVGLLAVVGLVVLIATRR